MMKRCALHRIALSGAALAAATGCASLPDQGHGGAAAEKARSIHETAITLDTHLDTPANLVSPRGFDITKRYDTDREGFQVDLPRMNEGGLDGGFWAIYTPQGPLTPEAYAKVRDIALLRSAAIREMAARHSDSFGVALRASDAARIDAEGRKIVFQSIENSYPLGEDISMVETFYKLGVRMIGPVHNGNNQFADSTNDASGPRWNGLSPLGVQLVKEANRLGMVVDGSHASDVAIDQMIDLSATPIILSHHGADGPYQHPRNAPDELLKKLAAKGGVIQMNALGSFIKTLQQSPERLAALKDLRDKWGSIDDLPADKFDAYLDERQAIDAKYPEVRAEFSDYMDQFLYTLRLIGPEHVGVGADWDGGGGVNGMRDVSQLPRITERLLAEGYSEADIRNIWGGNVLRVLKAAEDHAASGAVR
jgi:membrane dipeptidase